MLIRQSAFVSAFIVLTTITANANEINATSVGNNTAYEVGVSGLDNSILINQQSNGATIKSQITGSGNSFDYQQLDTTSLGGNNSIDFDVIGHGNNITFKQDGSLNKIYGKDVATDFEVTGDNNQWTVEQKGTSNELLITPRKFTASWGTTSNNDIVDVKQIGDRNKIELLNENSPNTSTNGRRITMLQEGNDNNITAVGAHTSSSVLNFSQRGHNNKINATARAEDLNSLAGANSVQTMNISQTGDLNYAEGYAWRNGSTLNVNQTGFANRAFAYVRLGHSLSVTQTGNENLMNSAFQYVGSGNLTQVGNKNNIALSNSTGSIFGANANGNYTISQNGNNNTAKIAGSGYNNTFNVTQNGNGNTYNLNHTGDNGVYSITQTAY